MPRPVPDVGDQPVGPRFLGPAEEDRRLGEIGRELDPVVFVPERISVGDLQPVAGLAWQVVPGEAEADLVFPWAQTVGPLVDVGRAAAALESERQRPASVRVRALAGGPGADVTGRVEAVGEE